MNAMLPLGVRAPQFAPQESGLNSMMRVLQLKGALEESDQRSRTIDRQNRLDQVLAGGGDAGALRKAGFLTEANAWEKNAAEIANKQAETTGKNVETTSKVLSQYRDSLSSITNADQARQWVQAQYADPNLASLTKGGVPLETAMASIPTDPAQFEQWKLRSALGMTRFIELNKPQTHYANTGQTTNIVQTPGLGGAPQVVGSMQNTATPGDILSAQDRAASRAQAERHHKENVAANLSKPFEVTGPDGQAVLVQQNQQGNILPVQGYSPKGGGKPLPQAALKQITEVRDNAVTINNLADSFKDGYGGKGVLGFGADASMATKGVLGTDKDAVEWWKNYRKQAELVERHSLFGASLTPGEQESWRSADISPGMDKDVIKRNLATRAALSRKVLDTTRQDLIDAGHNPERVNAIAARGPQARTDTTANVPNVPSASDIEAELRRRQGKK